MQAGLAQRARIVLLAADGLTNVEIAMRVGVSRPTVTSWRARYERSGISGLSDAARWGPPAHDRAPADRGGDTEGAAE
jgi:transposase